MRRYAAILAIFPAIFLASCGDKGKGDPEKVELTDAEKAIVYAERTEEAERILGAKVRRARPALPLDSLKLAENPQNSDEPYAGREVAEKRLDQLEVEELYRRFGDAFIEVELVMSPGRPYAWAEIEKGGAPTDKMAKIAKILIRKEKELGRGARGKHLANLVLLARNARRVWLDARQHQSALLERDFDRLGKDCEYFSKEISDVLTGVTSRLADEEEPDDDEDILDEVETTTDDLSIEEEATK